MATIALVDDDRNILTSVSIALESEGYRVETYTDGASALEGLSARPPNLAILDIKMPRMDGMELLRRLRQKTDLPVIFLTSKDDEIDELFGLKMGADDFIRKPFSQRLLVERVRAVLRRGSAREAAAKTPSGQSRSLERGQLVMDQERHTCTWKGEPVTLTVTEFLILHSLAQRPGVVKSRDSLMDSAYDEQVYVDDRTIDSHIKRLAQEVQGGRRRVRHDRDALRRRLPLPRSVSWPKGPVQDAAHLTGQWWLRPAKPCTSRGRARAFPAAFLGWITVPFRRLLGHYVFSSLTGRIVFLNLAALVVLVMGVLYLNQFRDGLIDARVESLMTQGEIIAGAIAASATVETDSIMIDPEKLLELQAGQSMPPGGDQLDSLDFPINPGTRGAGAEAPDLADAHARAHLRPRRQPAARFASISIRAARSCTTTCRRWRSRTRASSRASRRWFSGLFRRSDLPVYYEQPGGSGAAYPEVMSALAGNPATVRAHLRQGRADRLGGGAGAALSRRARRAAAFHPGRRHRQDRLGRAARHPARLRRRRAW